MKAMLLERVGASLRLRDIPVPEPGAGTVRVRVGACAVCRTDLHVCDGDLPDPTLPLVLGHEIVGVVDAVGEGAAFALGERVGVPWLGGTCGSCESCRAGRENLCDDARFTGYQLDGISPPRGRPRTLRLAGLRSAQVAVRAIRLRLRACETS